MTKQTITKEERKAANKALAADIRALVASGKADEAYALVTDKGEHWTTLVNGAVKAMQAKADKAAEKAKADKADKAPKGKADKATAKADETPAVSADVAILLQQVQALQDALQAMTAPAAVPTPAAPAAPAATWILRDPEASPSGFALCVSNRVKAILSEHNANLRKDARTEALQCAKWCDAAANAESDKAERDRLTKKAGVYRKAAATLKNA